MQDYYLKGHKLTNETSTKYLGVNLSEKLSWDVHVDYVAGRANGINNNNNLYFNVDLVISTINISYKAIYRRESYLHSFFF